MTDERLREIRERAEKATPGPWYVDDVKSVRSLTEPGDSLDGDIFDCGCGCCDGVRPKPENLTFIAHARQDISDLLAEIGRLRPQSA